MLAINPLNEPIAQESRRSVQTFQVIRHQPRGTVVRFV